MISIQKAEEIILKCSGMRKHRHSDISVAEFERPPKRVRISCAEPVIHSYETVSGECTVTLGQGEKQMARRSHRTWLTREELVYFRSCAKKLCRSQNLDGILHEAYSQADGFDRATRSFGSDDLAMNKDYMEQRGLEKWSSSYHSLVRSAKIVEVKAAVLLEQSSQFLSGTENPSKLAEISCETSKQSREFARFLASVDASAAMQVREEKEESPHK